MGTDCTLASEDGRPRKKMQPRPGYQPQKSVAKFRLSPSSSMRAQITPIIGDDERLRKKMQPRPKKISGERRERHEIADRFGRA
jgi:hypothetical protein